LNLLGGKLKAIKGYSVFTFLIFVSLQSLAQIDMNFRRANAVVLYEFKETSGDIINDTSSIGTPLNLTIADASTAAISRGNGFIELKTRNLISSAAAATKVINACKTTNELTLEMWVENNESAKLTTGFYPAMTAQPNRLLALSTNLTKNNFYIGQFYDDNDFYYSAINTSGNEKTATPGGSLNNPIKSIANQIILPSLEVNSPPNQTVQKIVMTLNAQKNAKLYLSDRDGSLSLAAKTSTGFGDTAANFSTWYTDAKLTLGNIASTFNEVKTAPSDFTGCDTAQSISANSGCKANSRYWKGKIYLVAVYCKALTETQILGERSQMQVRNSSPDINTGINITENLLKAQTIFQRLTSVKIPLYDPVLKEMAAKLDQNDAVAAAAVATQDSRFYNYTVRDFASKMSNRAETTNVPLNDFTTTVIGAVRDEISAQRLLFDNITYVADPKLVAVPSAEVTDILRSNNHYSALDNQKIDLVKVIKATTQRIFNGTKAVDMPTPAGLLTSRSWLSEHAVAGTNRRLVEYSLREFLCTPLEKIADSTGPDNVVGRDIDRFPGGVHTKFTTTCRACHTVMDGFRPAFSQFTFNSDYVMHTFTSPSVNTTDDEAKGSGIFTSKETGATFIHDKINKNGTVFPGGKITTDDNWVNNASYGANLPYFNWTRLKGKGIQEYGKALAESKQFPLCMAKRVFATVCKRDVASTDDTLISEAAQEFSSRNYNLKYLFQKIVVSKQCIGGK